MPALRGTREELPQAGEADLRLWTLFAFASPLILSCKPSRSQRQWVAGIVQRAIGPLEYCCERYFERFDSGYVVFFPVAWWCFGFAIPNQQTYIAAKNLAVLHLSLFVGLTLLLCCLGPFVLWPRLGLLTFPASFTLLIYLTPPYGFGFWEHLHRTLADSHVVVVPTASRCVWWRQTPESDIAHTGLIIGLVFSLLNVKFALLQKVVVGSESAVMFQGAVITSADVLLLLLWTARLLHVCLHARRVVDTRVGGFLSICRDPNKKSLGAMTTMTPVVPV